MLWKPGSRAAVRLMAVSCLLILCAGATAARPALLPDVVPVGPAPQQSTRPLRLAALDPADFSAGLPVPPRKPAASAPELADQGPFGLTVRPQGSLAARWSILGPIITLEQHILVRCRAQPAICPAAAAKFIRIVDAGRDRRGRALVGTINRAINLAIRWKSDLAQYGAPDVWASPLMTFSSGAGDCEDYAIAKYVALRDAGMAAADLRLVVAHDRIVNQDHMVAAARVDGRWLILDNRTMRLVADRDVPNLTPLAALGGDLEAPAYAVTATPKAPKLQAGAGLEHGSFAALL